jgi:LysM repeat protein
LSRAGAAAIALALAACLHRPPPRIGAGPEASGAVHVEPDLVGVVHVVRRGETIYRIARTYGIDARELMDVNGLSDPRQLEVGAELFIPGAERELEVPPLGAEGAPARDAVSGTAPLPREPGGVGKPVQRLAQAKELPLRHAAMVAAIREVAEALEARGLYP